MNIEELKKALAASNKEKAAAEKRADVAEANEKKAVAERDEAVKQLEAAKAASSPEDVEKITTLTAERDAAVAKSEELQKHLDDAPVDNRVPGTATVGKTKYKFKDGFKIVKCKFNDKAITMEATEALKNKELMAHLVKIGFGGLEVAE